MIRPRRRPKRRPRRRRRNRRTRPRCSQKLDTNSDGKLDLDEFKNLFTVMPHAEGKEGEVDADPVDLEFVFKSLDANGDKTLSTRRSSRVSSPPSRRRRSKAADRRSTHPSADSKQSVCVFAPNGRRKIAQGGAGFRRIPGCDVADPPSNLPLRIPKRYKASGR
jgi:hypothetical protein